MKRNVWQAFLKQRLLISGYKLSYIKRLVMKNQCKQVVFEPALSVPDSSTNNDKSLKTSPKTNLPEDNLRRLEAALLRPSVLYHVFKALPR